MEKITSGNDVFEIVTSVPYNHVIWNIGKNMIDGYLPLAISICITKNLIGGTSNYNKAVDNGIKVYEKKLHKQEEDRKEEERVKAKRIKLAAKRAERIARKKEEEMERQIEIQKEAIIRAKLATFESNGVSYKL